MVHEEERAPRLWVLLVADLACGLAAAWVASLPGATGWLGLLVAAVAGAFVLAGIGLLARVSWTAWFGEAASGAVALFGAFGLVQVIQCTGECWAALAMGFCLVLIALGVGMGIANHLGHLPPEDRDQRPAAEQTPSPREL